jgi:hypothetical protein
MAERKAGNGRIVYCGCNLDHTIRGHDAGDFGGFLQALALRAGASPRVRLPDPGHRSVVLRHGMSADRRMIFAFAEEPGEELRLVWRRGFVKTPSLRELITGQSVAVEELSCTVRTNEWGVAVLTEENGAETRRRGEAETAGEASGSSAVSSRDSAH